MNNDDLLTLVSIDATRSGLCRRAQVAAATDELATAPQKARLRPASVLLGLILTTASAPALASQEPLLPRQAGDSSARPLQQDAPAATFSVDTTSDANLSACTAAANDCSLRGAISRSNAAAGADVIDFAIPVDTDIGCSAVTGICRITLGSNLPLITGSVTIDGYTQAGALPNTIPAPGANNAQLKIEVTNQPGFTTFALLVNPNVSVSVSGLALFLPSLGMIHHNLGVEITLVGNWFGVTAMGLAPDYPQQGRVFLANVAARHVRVGGPDPADRNVFAGSGRDLSNPPLPGGGGGQLRVNSNATTRGSILFQGNLWGLAPDGLTPLPFREGLLINPDDGPGETPEVLVLDNRFAQAVRNHGGDLGGLLRFRSDTVMQTTARVQRNLFGLGVDGSVIGGQRHHIEVVAASNNDVPRLLVGGLGAGEGNVFAGSRVGVPVIPIALGYAVVLPSSTLSTFIEFVGNQMLGNAGGGIDIPNGSAYGRSPNDVGDLDDGPNNQQNFPQISAYAVNAASFDVTYQVDSLPANSSYPLRVDFYKALGDEGELLLDSDVYTLAEARQDKAVSLMIPPGVSLDANDVIVAIATDAEGRSSEFSFHTVALSVFDTPDPQLAGLPFTVEVEATTPGPFTPNGSVRVSLDTNPATTCTVTLAPTATAQLSSGSCELIAMQAGSHTLTATYEALAGAFASATGGNVQATAPHTVTTPGPEQVSFASCQGVALENRELIVLINRPSGGITNAQVDLSHEPGSATPGVDYLPPADQSLTWLPGDFEPKEIAVPIFSDGLAEPVETFRLRLSNPINTAIIPHALIEFRIRDGDDAGFADGFEGNCPT